MNLKNFSVLGHALMVVGIVPLVWWKALFTLNPLALIVQLVGVSTMIWARITFGSRSFHALANPTDGQLITRGPYQCIRHPIYFSILLIAWAGIVVHASWLNCISGLIIVLGVWVRIYCEEQLLRAHYPEYDQYARKTKRLIPYIF